MNRVAAIVSAFVVAGASWAQAPKPTLADLSWLAGCWEGGRPESKYEEQWMAPRGQTMMGMSRTVSQEKTVAFEFLRIHQEADGIYYTSIPSGQAQASFKLVKHEAGNVVFENLEHDFPQRIIYRLEKDGGLMAMIQGKSKGAIKQVDFPMRRIRCD